MKDLISRQAAIDALARTAREKFNLSDEFNHYLAGLMDGEVAIKALPAAQPEIIRCKECKHSEHWYRDKRRCFLWVGDGIDVFDDGFCNYAERRTDG